VPMLNNIVEGIFTIILGLLLAGFIIVCVIAVVHAVCASYDVLRDAVAAYRKRNQ